MGYALLGVESLTAILLLLAVVVAWVAEGERRRWRIALGVLLAALPLAFGACFSWAAWYTQDMQLIWHSWGGPAIAWTAALAIGLAALVFLARWPTGEAGTLAARSWSRGKLAMASAAAFVLFVATYWNMDTAAKIQLAALRAEAGTLALAATPPRVPDRDNAAPLYREAFEALLDSKALAADTKSRRFAKSQQWFAPPSVVLDFTDPDLAAYLHRQSSGLELLRRAAARSGCNFERSFGRSDPMLPELLGMREGAGVLALDARFKAARGDMAGALADVAAILQIARHMAGEPILMGVLVAYRIETVGAQTLEAVLTSGMPACSDLAALKSLGSISYRAAMQRALQMEEAMGLSAFAALAEGNDHRGFAGLGVNASSVDFGPAAAIWRLFFMPDDLAVYRLRLNTVSRYLDLPYKAASTSTVQPFSTGYSVPNTLVASALTPNLPEVATWPARADTCHRLAQLAIAIACYRAAVGKYPTQLDDLVPVYLPSLPVDPYTGQSLKMVVRDGGLVLYSVGPDRIDDGAKPANLNERDPKGDITLRIGKNVPPPPPLMPPAS